MSQELGTFELFVTGNGLVKREQLQSCRVAQDALRRWGIEKSLEEICVYKGFLDLNQIASILAEIKKQLNISIPRPAIYAFSPEKEQEIQDQVITSGAHGSAQVDECRKIQQAAKKLGLSLSIGELLIAKSYASPPGAASSAPAKAAPAPRKAVPARRPAPAAGRAGASSGKPRTTRKQAPPAPKKKSNQMMYIGIGGGVAALLLIVVIAAMSGKSDPPPVVPVAKPVKPKGDRVVLMSAGKTQTAVYTEANLLEMHTGKTVTATHQVPNDTPVTVLGFMRTEKTLWYRIRTPRGIEGWAIYSTVKATFDMANRRYEDKSQDFSEKLAVKRGKPLPVARNTPPKRVEPAPPTPKPEPAPAVVPPTTPEPEPAPPVAAPSSPLVGSYSFDEGRGTTTNDSSDAKNDATFENGVAWAPGYSGKALRFDGVDAFVSCGTTGLPAAEKPQTIAGRYSVDAVPAQVQTMILMENKDGGSGLHLGFRDSKLAVWKRDGTVLVAADPPADPAGGAKNGLLGTYYGDKDLRTPSLRRIDPQISYDFGKGSAHPSLPQDRFSVRWTGFVTPKHSEAYTFHALTDDGVRMWVDDKPVMDHWRGQAAKETNSRTITLEAGKPVPIRIEYYDGTNDAVCRLSWSSASQNKEVVPAEALSPPAPWHHVAYTFDGSTHKLFVNGALKTQSNAPAAAGKPDTLELGRGFKGLLDDVEIHARAMSEARVRAMAPDGDVAIAEAGKPSAGAAPAGPVANKPKPPRRPPPSDPKQAEKETKAKALWDKALALEKAGKLGEAQKALREIRKKYRSTIFYFDKMIEIADKINGLGRELALAALQKKTALYRKPHQDSWYAYEFRPPDGWHGVPPAKKWSGDEDSSEVNYRGQTIRVSQYTSPFLEGLYMKVYKTFAAPNVDILQESVRRYHDRQYGKLTEQEDFPAAKPGRQPFLRKVYKSEKGDWIVMYYFYSQKKALALVGYWRPRFQNTFFVTITTIGPGGSRSTQKSKEVVVNADDFKLALDLYDKTAQTFWIYDAATRQGMRTKLNKGALCADWKIMRSPKGWYTIEYATRDDFAKRVGKELEMIQMLYKRTIPTGKGFPNCWVKVFDREEDFNYYYGGYGAAAYWSPLQEEIVCYRFQGDKVQAGEAKEEFTISEKKNPEEVTFKILYHEAFHQYMYYYMGRERFVYVPSWVNEGLGDYFFGGEWNRGKFDIGLNDWRIKVIFKAVKENKHVPLKDIIRYRQSDYYSKASLCYAQGWSMNYFMLMTDTGKKKGYFRLPPMMFQALKTSGDWEKATEKVFKGVNLDQMEKEWKEWVLSLPVKLDEKEAK